jgi:phosphate transport system substrate-binding protein
MLAKLFSSGGTVMSKRVCMVLLCASALFVPIAAAFAVPNAPRAAGVSSGVVSTEGLDLQAARAKMMTKRGRLVAYTRKWDISGLPHYSPKHAVSGTIRVWGTNYITDGLLAGYWEDTFRKYHPGVKFAWHTKTTLAAVPSLVFGVSDVGIGRKITFSELEMFQRYTNRNPVEITLATGSYDVPGWNPGYGIVVNSANPIGQVSLRQLDGIFGAERNGGWDGTSWRPQWARGPEDNIRTWGQLGLTGQWANKPIHVYGLTLRYHQAIEMSDKLLKSSDKWNEHLRIYANFVGKKGTLERGLSEDLAKDPYGIAYIAAPTTDLGRDKAQQPDLKVLKVAAKDGGPYVPYTIDTLHDRTYPLADEIYVYADRGPKQMDPKVLEFMRFVMSQEGQAQVMRDGKYLPLTAGIVQAQIAKINALDK